MKLTPYQVRVLLRTQKLHDSGFSFQSYLQSGKKKMMAGGIGLIIASVGWWWYIGLPLISMLVLGILLGLIMREFRTYRITKKVWPLSEEITNWERVAQLIKENQ